MNWEESLKRQETATFNTLPVTGEDGYEIIEQPDSVFVGGHFAISPRTPMTRTTPDYWYDAERPY